METTLGLLFPEPATARTGALGWTEAAVHWFTESTRDIAIASRVKVNQWYSDFPDADGKFAARLTSEVDVDHHQALDELYVHHLLRRRWDDVRYEEGGVGPDFRVYERGECAAGIEVASLFQREDWSEEERRHWRLADAINSRLRPTAGYMLDFEIERANRDPAPRRISDFISHRLEELPPIEEFRLPTQAGIDDLPSVVYDERGVRLRVRFIPLHVDAPARTDPDAVIVGTGPVIGGAVNTPVRLRDRVEKKAGGRYDIGDTPFLVAVGMHDLFDQDPEVIAAFYGHEAVEYPGRIFRRNDGIFGVDKGRPEGRHRRLSAVAVIRKIFVWEPENISVAVLHNPYAGRPWPDDYLPATRRFGEVGSNESGTQFNWVEAVSDGSSGSNTAIRPD